VDADLKRNGVLAQAEVLEVSGNRVGDYDSAAPAPMRFHLRVHPDGADPVEAKVTQLVPINLAYHLEPGAWVPVVHDPANPSKAAVDLDGKSAAGQAAQAEAVAAQQEHMKQIQEMTGEDPNRPKGPADVADAIRTAQELAQQNAQLVEWARQAGVPGMQPPSGVPGAQPPGPQPPGTEAAGEGDPIERLERLAKLRDSGAISDQEFERLKGEILG
jgi:Short C-terminal domain